MKIDSNKGTSTSTAELNNRKESYYWILEQKTTTKQYEKNNNNKMYEKLLRHNECLYFL